MVKQVFALAVLAATMQVGTAQTGSAHNYVPSEGYVPDRATAIKIAVAVWEPIYGKSAVAKQAPYSAKLTGDVWQVEGSLPSGNTRGGVALAEIDRFKGTILRVSHGK